MPNAMNDQPLIEADLASVPANLPEPEDDGACDHLCGLTMPSIPMPSTDGHVVDLGARRGTVIAYFYPMTGRPGVALPAGWDQIPGARGDRSHVSAEFDKKEMHCKLYSSRAGLREVSTNQKP